MVSGKLLNNSANVWVEKLKLAPHPEGVAPGFDFSDSEMGNRKHLVEIYPQYRELIARLTQIG